MPEKELKKTKFDKITEVCLKRAIFYPSSEIYGGFSGFFDYGSVGLRIKRNFENLWREYFLALDSNFHEIDTASIMPENVFKASGHLVHFLDPIVECKKCGMTERADHILERHLKESFEGLSPKELDDLIKKHNIKCHNCGGELKDVGVVNMMFPVNVGPYEGGARGYLRPETAQGVYVNFKREYLANRERLPLGLAIVGRAFRNEISPRQALFRVREFTQAELQVFFNPHEVNKHPQFDEVKDYEVNVVFVKERGKKTGSYKMSEVVKKGFPEYYVYYMAKIQQFYESLGVPKDKFRFFEKSEEERAHYNKYQFDVEIHHDSLEGFKEVAGYHYRTDYDLTGHQKTSGQSMEINKDGKKFIPQVIELSFGVDRSVFALLDLAFKEGEFKEGKRVYFSLNPRLAPYLIGVYPLVSKEGIDEKAKQVFFLLKNFDAWYDEGGSIGKRYARADEIGVPFGITIDFDTLKDDTVTIRDRDTQKQTRIKINDLPDELYSRIL